MIVKQHNSLKNHHRIKVTVTLDMKGTKSVLYWPDKAHRRFSNPEKSGYVIGWDISDYDNLIYDRDEEINDESNSSSNGYNVRREGCSSSDRIHICCGVISDRQAEHIVDWNSFNLFCFDKTEEVLSLDNEQALIYPKVIARWFDSEQDDITSSGDSSLPKIIGRWWSDNDIRDSCGTVVLYEYMYGHAYYHHVESTSKELHFVLDRINSSESFMYFLSQLVDDKGQIKQSLKSRYMNQSKESAECPKRQKNTTHAPPPKSGRTSKILSATARELSKYSFFFSHIMSMEYYVGSEQIYFGCGCFVYVKPFHPLWRFQQIISKKGKTQKGFPSKQKTSRADLRESSMMVVTFLDAIFGILIGLIFLFHTKFVLHLLESYTSHIYRVLSSSVAFLNDFPFGFKLNVPLTNMINRESTRLLMLQKMSLGLLTQNERLILIKILAIIAIVMGGSSLIALIMDLYSLMTAHLRLMGNFFRIVWSFYASISNSLLKLFGGKKKNILRLRSDTMDYDFMQLMLGILLFTVATFLFTTIFVHYIFFSYIIHFVILLFQIVLFFIYFGLSEAPALSEIFRFKDKCRFPARIYFEALSQVRYTRKNVKFFFLKSRVEPAGHQLMRNIEPCTTRVISSLSLFFVECASGKMSSAEQFLVSKDS